MWRLFPLVLVLACGGKDDDGDVLGDTGATGTETGAPGGGGDTVDPDVNSYVPAGYGASSPARVVFLGDSITGGAGASSGELGYLPLLTEDVSSAWSDYAALDLQSLYGDIEVIDVSVGGATTGSLLFQQLGALESAVGGYPVSGETVIVFTIGGNDLFEALNPFMSAQAVADETLGNFEAIFADLTDPSHFPDGVYVYATNVYEPTDGEGATPSCFLGYDFSADLPVFDAFNDDLMALGEEMGVSIVDLRGHFLGHGHNHDDDSLAAYHPDDATLWFDSDCIHPNDRGHHEIRRLFYAAISATDLPLDIP